MSRSSWSVDEVDGGDERPRGPSSSSAATGDQPVDRGPHGGQRGAQVVRDRAQDARCWSRRPAPARPRGCRARAAGGTPAPGRSARRSASSTRWSRGPQRRARAGPARGRRRPATRESASSGAPARGPCRWWPPAASRRRLRASSDTDVLAERLAQPLDDRLGGVLAGEHRLRQRRQGGRLGARPRRLGRRAARPVDDGRDPGRDRRRRPAAPPELVGLGDGEPCRPGGVKNQFSVRNPIVAASSEGSRPPTSATSTVPARKSRTASGQLVGLVERLQHEVSSDRQQQGDRPAERPAGVRLSGERSAAVRPAAADLLVGDQVHVDGRRRARRSARPSRR